jgi:SAM-dependent methyltransferase
MPYPPPQQAPWPFSLPPGLAPGDVAAIASEADRLGAQAQYGWGHTIDFGAFRKDGLLGDDFLHTAGAFDSWGWWPPRIDGLSVADVGCYTGGLSLLLAHRGARVVYAIDEIPAHVAQCEFLARTFDLPSVRPVVASAYGLGREIASGSLDLVVLSGVLYHLSDMLVGLYALRDLLRPDGVLLIQSNAVEDYDRSYANFGRFVAGRWWQPTALCIQDMLEFMGFSECDLRFNAHQSCLARARRAEGEIPFTRGLNWPFGDLRDERPRSLDADLMAPAHPAQATRARLTTRLRGLAGHVRRWV